MLSKEIIRIFWGLTLCEGHLILFYQKRKDLLNSAGLVWEECVAFQKEVWGCRAALAVQRQPAKAVNTNQNPK